MLTRWTNAAAPEAFRFRLCFIEQKGTSFPPTTSSRRFARAYTPMHFRVLMSVVGQLIAVPAALFLLPTKCPDLGRTPAGDHASHGVTYSSSLGDIDPDIGLVSGDAADDSVADRISEVSTVDPKAGNLWRRRPFRQQKKWQKNVFKMMRRTGRDRENSVRRKDRRAGSPVVLDFFKNGIVDAADVVRGAFKTIALPFYAIPRRAVGVLSSVRRRGVQEEAAPESDSTVKYLTELQLAQESAERALTTPGWEEVAQRHGVTVWKKYFPKDEYGYKYPCVKARGMIDASAEQVMGMIVDSTRVLEYNRYSKGRTDIEHLGPHTKIVWNKAQPPLSKKLHDFCTLMHMQPLDDGSFMLITRATDHPEAPLLEGHVRSEILLGVTILKPAEDDPLRTEMTTVNHIVSNGVPVMLADKVSTKNAIDFIHNVESAALAASSAEGGNESESSPSRESIPPLAAAPA